MILESMVPWRNTEGGEEWESEGESECERERVSAKQREWVSEKQREWERERERKLKWIGDQKQKRVRKAKKRKSNRAEQSLFPLPYTSPLILRSFYIHFFIFLFFSVLSQIPQLLSMFDKKKKGYITMDDFVVSTRNERTQPLYFLIVCIFTPLSDACYVNAPGELLIFWYLH